MPRNVENQYCVTKLGNTSGSRFLSSLPLLQISPDNTTINKTAVFFLISWLLQ